MAQQLQTLLPESSWVLGEIRCTIIVHSMLYHLGYHAVLLQLLLKIHLNLPNKGRIPSIICGVSLSALSYATSPSFGATRSGRNPCPSAWIEDVLRSRRAGKHMDVDRRSVPPDLANLCPKTRLARSWASAPAKQISRSEEERTSTWVQFRCTHAKEPPKGLVDSNSPPKSRWIHRWVCVDTLDVGEVRVSPYNMSKVFFPAPFGSERARPVRVVRP